MRKSAPSYRWRRRCAAEEPRRAAHSSFLLPAFPGFFSFVAAWPKGRHRIPRLRFSFFHFLNRLSPPHTPPTFSSAFDYLWLFEQARLFFQIQFPASRVYFRENPWKRD